MWMWFSLESGTVGGVFPFAPLSLLYNECYFFFSGLAAWLEGSQFPDQGLSPGHGSKSQES